MWLIFAVALFTIAHVASKCPPGAVQGVNSYDCFLLVSDDPEDQQDAWDECWKLGGELASISSSRESYIVYSLVDVDKTGPYWIGANWDAGGLDGTFSWADNSPWNYINWDKGQPYLYPFVAGLCVTVDPKTRKWSTTYCLPQKRNYVCKLPSTQLPVAPSSPKPATSQCQPGWKYVSVTKKCYKVSTSPKSWYAALDNCRSLGGDLAMARTEAVTLAITALGRPHERYAIGLYNPKRCNTTSTSDCGRNAATPQCRNAAILCGHPSTSNQPPQHHRFAGALRWLRPLRPQSYVDTPCGRICGRTLRCRNACPHRPPQS